MNRIYLSLSLLYSMLVTAVFYSASGLLFAATNTDSSQSAVIGQMYDVLDDSQHYRRMDLLSAREQLWTRRMVRGYCSVPQSFRTLQCQRLIPHLLNVRSD